MQLPEDFVRGTRQLMGETRFNSYLEAFEKEAPVSIRLNVTKGRFVCDIPGDVTKEPSLCYKSFSIAGENDKAPSGVDGALLLGDVLFNTGGSCSRW